MQDLNFICKSVHVCLPGIIVEARGLCTCKKYLRRHDRYNRIKVC